MPFVATAISTPCINLAKRCNSQISDDRRTSLCLQRRPRHRVGSGRSEETGMTFTRKMHTFCCQQGSGSPRFQGPMSPRRRALCIGVAAAAVAAVAPVPALAAFPEKPITIVVPTAPGGANDAMARTVGHAMGAVLKQPIIVDNKAGGQRRDRQRIRQARRARWLHADARLYRHPCDEPGAAEAALRPGEGLRAGRHGRDVRPQLLVVNPAVKANNAKELVALLKASPDKMNYASAGNGTAPHFSAEMFKLATDTRMTACRRTRVRGRRSPTPSAARPT